MLIICKTSTQTPFTQTPTDSDLLFQSKAALDTRLAAREASRCVPAHVDESVRRHWPPMPVMAAVIDGQGRAPRNGTPWTIELLAELLAKVHMHVEAGEWKSARSRGRRAPLSPCTSVFTASVSPKLGLTNGGASSLAPV